MIVLKDSEKLVREDRAELSGDDGRKYGKGTLYLTNARLMFETENGIVPRLIGLHAIQSVVPVKKHELTVSYMNNDGTKIFTDRYKMRDGRNCEDWIEDFRNTCNASTSSGVGLTYSRSTAEDLGNKVDSLQDNRKNINDVVVDANSKTLTWKKVEGWRQFPEEHVWQGRNRLDLMNKKEWLAYKREANSLEETLLSLYNNYCESKTNRNIEECRKIRKAMRIVDKELFGKGEIPYKDVEADEIADTGSFSG